MTMEQFDSTSSDELDAAWDDNNQDTPIGVSGSPPVSQAPASRTAEPIDEEIDAGWDLEPTDVPAPHTTKP